MSRMLMVDEDNAKVVFLPQPNSLGHDAHQRSTY